VDAPEGCSMDTKTLVGVVVAVVVVLAGAFLVLGGSGGSSTQPAPGATGAASSSASASAGQAGGCPSSSVSLQGSGSTFVWPAMNSWSRRFHEKCPTVTVEYSGGGSGKGQKDIIERLVDFAGSDPPLARKFYEEYKGKIMQFPVVLGAVVVTYNVPELKGYQLRLDGETLAKIYLGEIRYWDDPAIKKLNPDVADRLPHREIIAVHRSDASGTTQIFTTFLYKASKGLWPRSLVGKSIEWPVDRKGRGIGQQGNPAVAQTIKATPYSLGYVEWAYALENGLPVALIRNPAGKFVAPSQETISAAFAIKNPPSPLDDWTSVAESFVYSNASPDAYPIAGQTFLLVWKSGYSHNKCIALKAFIRYIAGEGQDALPKGYAPLPPVLRGVAEKAAELLECGS
jgi:phosphate transport system substrate-binding protein